MANIDSIVSSLTSVIGTEKDKVKGHKVDDAGEFKKIAAAATKLPIVVLWFVIITDNPDQPYLSLFYLDEENFDAGTTNYYRFINNSYGSPAKLTDIHYKSDSDKFYVQFKDSPFLENYFEVNTKDVMSNNPIEFNRDYPDDFLKEIWKVTDKSGDVDTKITGRMGEFLTGKGTGDVDLEKAIEESLKSLKEKLTVLNNVQIYVYKETSRLFNLLKDKGVKSVMKSGEIVFYVVNLNVEYVYGKESTKPSYNDIKIALEKKWGDIKNIEINQDDLIIIDEWTGDENEPYPDIHIKNASGKCAKYEDTTPHFDDEVGEGESHKLMYNGIPLSLMKNIKGLILHNNTLYKVITSGSGDTYKFAEICIPDDNDDPIKYIKDLYGYFGYNIRLSGNVDEGDPTGKQTQAVSDTEINKLKKEAEKILKYAEGLIENGDKNNTVQLNEIKKNIKGILDRCYLLHDFNTKETNYIDLMRYILRECFNIGLIVKDDTSENQSGDYFNKSYRTLYFKIRVSDLYTIPLRESRYDKFNPKSRSIFEKLKIEILKKLEEAEFGSFFRIENMTCEKGPLETGDDSENDSENEYYKIEMMMDSLDPKNVFSDASTTKLVEIEKKMIDLEKYKDNTLKYNGENIKISLWRIGCANYIPSISGIPYNTMKLVWGSLGAGLGAALNTVSGIGEGIKALGPELERGRDRFKETDFGGYLGWGGGGFEADICKPRSSLVYYVKKFPPSRGTETGDIVGGDKTPSVVLETAELLGLRSVDEALKAAGENILSDKEKERLDAEQARRIKESGEEAEFSIAAAKKKKEENDLPEALKLYKNARKKTRGLFGYGYTKGGINEDLVKEINEGITNITKEIQQRKEDAQQAVNKRIAESKRLIKETRAAHPNAFGRTEPRLVVATMSPTQAEIERKEAIRSDRRIYTAPVEGDYCLTIKNDSWISLQNLDKCINSQYTLARPKKKNMTLTINNYDHGNFKINISRPNRHGNNYDVNLTELLSILNGKDTTVNGVVVHGSGKKYIYKPPNQGGGDSTKEIKLKLFINKLSSLRELLPYKFINEEDFDEESSEILNQINIILEEFLKLTAVQPDPSASGVSSSPQQTDSNASGQGQGQGDQGQQHQQGQSSGLSLQDQLRLAQQTGNTREMDRLKREMDRQNYYNRYGNMRGYPGYRGGPSYSAPSRVIGQPPVRMAAPAITPALSAPGQPVPGQPGQPVPGQPVPGQPVPGQPGQSEQDKKDEDDKEKSEQVDDDDKEEDEGDGEEDDEQEDVEEPPIIDDEMHKDIIVDLFKQKKDGVIDVSDKELEQLLIEQIKMTHKYELLKKQWFYLAKRNPGKLERENKENKDRIKYLEDKVFNILSQVISNNGRSSKSKSSLRRINSKLLGYVNEMRGEDSDISLVNTEKYVSILEAIDNEDDKKRNLSSKKKVTPRKNVKKTPKKKPTVKKPIRKRTRQRKRTPIKKKPDKKTPKNTPQKKNIQQRKKTPQKKKPIRLNKGKKSPNVVFKPRFEYDKEPVDLIKTPRKQNFNPVAMPSHNMITNNPPQQELDMLRPMM